MTYVCPECGMGFPKRRGKVKVGKDTELESWLDHVLLWLFLLTFLYSPTRTEIHCPGCEYVLIGESDEKEARSND